MGNKNDVKAFSKFIKMELLNIGSSQLDLAREMKMYWKDGTRKNVTGQMINNWLAGTSRLELFKDEMIAALNRLKE
mgnify:FL=1|jgi:transcriptional regulator with XRE-family HTH domain